MAKVIKLGDTPKYKFTCKSCKSTSIYNKWELKEYEDCYDMKCMEFRCPVCLKWNSVLKNRLNRHEIVEFFIEDETESNKNIRKSFLEKFLSLFKRLFSCIKHF